MASATISRALCHPCLQFSGGPLLSLVNKSVYIFKHLFLCRTLLSMEDCSENGELASTALQLSQPCGDRAGLDVRPAGWLNFLGNPESREAVQMNCYIKSRLLVQAEL